MSHKEIKVIFNFWVRLLEKETHLCGIMRYNQTQRLQGQLVTQTVKNLPVTQKTQVSSLGQEATLEKEMAIHSSILAWSIPWTEEPGQLPSMGSQRVGHDWATNILLAQY